MKKAISLLSVSGDTTGTAICCSTPDYYRWRHGTEAGELLYMSHRELGGVLEEQQKYAEAIAAYKMAAEFEIISPEDLETWAEASFAVGSCRALVEFDRLIAIEPRAELLRRREECWAVIRRRAFP